MRHLTVFGCDLDEAALFRDRAPAFGITPVITAEPLSASTMNLAAGARCISVSHKTPISTAQLDALSAAGIRYISTRSIGYDHLDAAYASSIGLTVENVAYSPDGVADHTVMLILMGLRHARSTVLRVEKHDYRLPPARGRELRDLTIGVVGTGRIGAAVIDRLRGFGCRILAVDSRRASPAEYVTLDELLKRSDVVTLHVPLTAPTHHLLNVRTLERLKPGALIVNTGRGALVDTAALLEALESGRVGGAALDVIEGEEGVFYADRRRRPVDDATFARLHALPSVIITPHTGYYTEGALADTVDASLANCLRFEEGRAA